MLEQGASSGENMQGLQQSSALNTCYSNDNHNDNNYLIIIISRPEESPVARFGDFCSDSNLWLREENRIENVINAVRASD